MKDESKSRHWPFIRTLFLATAMTLAIPVSYVLSIGPALWLGQRGYITAQQFRVIYAPLERLERVWPWIGDAFGRYVDLWMPPE